MKFNIQYEICLDEDFPNDVNWVTVDAETEEEAIKKFNDLHIFKAVILSIKKDGESK